jgi:predicted DNA-binding transcriptional regulator AlpA
LEAKVNAQLPEYLDRQRIISVRQMAQLLGFSIAHVRRMYRTGKIPPPFKIGERKLGWTSAVAIDLTSPSNTDKAA